MRFSHTLRFSYRLFRRRRKGAAARTRIPQKAGSTVPRHPFFFGWIGSVVSAGSTAGASDDPAFTEKMTTACIYKVYVKRFCNLELLAQENHTLHLFELRSALRESIDYIKLGKKVRTQLLVQGEGVYRAESLLLIYRIFQRIIEELVEELPSLTSLDVQVKGDGGLLSMALWLSGAGVENAIEDLSQEEQDVLHAGSYLEKQTVPGTLFFRVRDLPGGVS